MELIDKRIINRAHIAIKCLPLNCNFYIDAKDYGLNAQEVFELKEKYSSTSKKWFKNNESVEKTFQWLIIIGVLRREVDGQGLTSKIRLTPLGRKIIQDTPSLARSSAGFSEQLKHWFNRNFLIQ